MEFINTITGISMSNSLTKTLLDKWNETTENPYTKGIVPSGRYEISDTIKRIRRNQITDYYSDYNYASTSTDVEKIQDKKRKDQESLETYKSVFDWEEKYSVDTEFSVAAVENIYINVPCESKEEALEYINHDKQIEAPDESKCYETSLEIDQEEGSRDLTVSLRDLRLKGKEIVELTKTYPKELPT